MRRLNKALTALLVGGCLSLGATPAHAGWGFSFSRGFWSGHGSHGDNGNGGDFGFNSGGTSNQNKKGGFYQTPNSPGSNGNGSCDSNPGEPAPSAVPEIDPAGMGTLIALVGGGIALATARRRKSVA